MGLEKIVNGNGYIWDIQNINYMVRFEELIQFVKDETWADVFEDSDIERDLGCTGDDFSELMEKYALRYSVNMESYLWYFHHTEEGLSSMSFFSRPNELVKHIPVTPLLLYEFVQKGKWDLNYPEHTLPKRRYDMIFNQVFILIIAVIIIYFSFKQ